MNAPFYLSNIKYTIKTKLFKTFYKKKKALTPKNLFAVGYGEIRLKLSFATNKTIKNNNKKYRTPTSAQRVRCGKRSNRSKRQ